MRTLQTLCSRVSPQLPKQVSRRRYQPPQNSLMPPKRSGLQKEVLALYRRALRMVKTKPTPVQPKFRLFVRYSFRATATKVSYHDVNTIEYLLRKGRREIETFENNSVKDCWVSSEMVKWEGSEQRNKISQNLQGKQ